MKYGEAYGDDGLWEGSLRVFDNRMTSILATMPKLSVNVRTAVGQRTISENCAHMECNDLVLICLHCKQDPDLLFHTAACKEKHEAKLGATASA